MKVIKTNISLKIEIKEKSPFLWFDLSLYATLKSYISTEREINTEFDKINGNFIILDQSQVIGPFVLACKFQEVFWSMFEQSYLWR